MEDGRMEGWEVAPSQGGGVQEKGFVTTLHNILQKKKARAGKPKGRGKKFGVKDYPALPLPKNSVAMPFPLPHSRCCYGFQRD